MKNIFLASLILFSVASFSFAQNAGTVQTNTGTVQTNTGTKNTDSQVLPKITNPLKFDDLPSLVNALIDLALRVGTILAVLALVWVGFRFILAQGDPGKLNDAKSALWWVIIGIAILFGSKIIVEIIKGTLGQFTDPSQIKINKP